MKNFNYNEEVIAEKLYCCKLKELIPISYIFDAYSNNLFRTAFNNIQNINENLSKSKCKIYFQTALDNLDILIFFE